MNMGCSPMEVLQRGKITVILLALHLHTHTHARRENRWSSPKKQEISSPDSFFYAPLTRSSRRAKRMMSIWWKKEALLVIHGVAEEILLQPRRSSDHTHSPPKIMSESTHSLTHSLLPLPWIHLCEFWLKTDAVRVALVAGHALHARHMQ